MRCRPAPLAPFREDSVRCLELGATDYLTKPLSHRELIARIHAQLRRGGREWQPTKPTAETRLQVGTITLDLEEHSVNKGPICEPDRHRVPLASPPDVEQRAATIQRVSC
jgi:DNA-binding response OmpR family regulator